MVIGGSTKGFRPVVLGPMGELTDVASAKRAVLGVWMVRPDEELEEVLARMSTWVFLIFSSVRVRCGGGRFGSVSAGDTGLYFRFWLSDMLSDAAAG